MQAGTRCRLVERDAGCAKHFEFWGRRRQRIRSSCCSGCAASPTSCSGHLNNSLRRVNHRCCRRLRLPSRRSCRRLQRAKQRQRLWMQKSCRLPISHSSSNSSSNSSSKISNSNSISSSNSSSSNSSRSRRLRRLRPQTHQLAGRAVLLLLLLQGCGGRVQSAGGDAPGASGVVCDSPGQENIVYAPVWADAGSRGIRGRRGSLLCVPAHAQGRRSRTRGIDGFHWLLRSRVGEGAQAGAGCERRISCSVHAGRGRTQAGRVDHEQSGRLCASCRVSGACLRYRFRHSTDRCHFGACPDYCCGRRGDCLHQRVQVFQGPQARDQDQDRDRRRRLLHGQCGERTACASQAGGGSPGRSAAARAIGAQGQPQAALISVSVSWSEECQIVDVPGVWCGVLASWWLTAPCCAGRSGGGTRCGLGAFFSVSTAAGGARPGVVVRVPVCADADAAAAAVRARRHALAATARAAVPAAAAAVQHGLVGVSLIVCACHWGVRPLSRFLCGRHPAMMQAAWQAQRAASWQNEAQTQFERGRLAQKAAEDVSMQAMFSSFMPPYRY